MGYIEISRWFDDCYGEWSAVHERIVEITVEPISYCTDRKFISDYIIGIRRPPTHIEFCMTEEEWLFQRFNNNEPAFNIRFGYYPLQQHITDADIKYAFKYKHFIETKHYELTHHWSIQRSFTEHANNLILGTTTHE